MARQTLFRKVVRVVNVVMLLSLVSNLVLPVISAAGLPASKSPYMTDRNNDHGLTEVKSDGQKAIQSRSALTTSLLDPTSHPEQQNKTGFDDPLKANPATMASPGNPNDKQISVDPSLQIVQGSWIVEGDAILSPTGIIQLTPDQDGQAGWAWNAEQLDLTQNFYKAFIVYLGDDDNGADGIAFILQSNDPPAQGSP